MAGPVPVRVVYAITGMVAGVLAVAVLLWARYAPKSFVRAMVCLRLMRVAPAADRQALVTPA